MGYQAVGNRCAVCFESLCLPIPRETALSVLSEKGFKVLDVDIIGLARGCAGSSKYLLGAKLSDAPKIVDCSSFVKWLYGMCGIWLPRRTIQQREFGAPIPLCEIAKGDVVFVSGRINYYNDDPKNGVGHVGIATGSGTVIHAANKKMGVIESPIDNFIATTKFRGVRRYIPKGESVITLLTPKEREVETSDDIRWIILQAL